MNQNITKNNHENYVEGNKLAWEDSFAHSTSGFGEDHAKILKEETLPFLHPNFIQELRQYDLKDKKLLHLCCNNGRELASIVKGFEASSGVGIDIAENIVAQANKNAVEAGIPCEYFACNVLEIQEQYIGQYDAVFFTIGAICWFEDLTELFQVASIYLKPGGYIFIYEAHPLQDIIPMPGDPSYDPENELKIGWSYFKKEPFVDEMGMGYMGDQNRKSKTFTSFSHTMSDYINGLAKNGMCIQSCEEYDYDSACCYPHLSGMGFPLTLMMTAKKI